ncbi:MAG: hypothetical protein JRN20_19895 [Nitrososphaerota archaeon]|nr:hypothetical protein [Nitrososphaerota archaeon]
MTKKELPPGEVRLGKKDLRIAILLSAIVGTWLVSFNDGETILAGSYGGSLHIRIFLDYATPFVVSIVTSAVHHRKYR